MTMQRPFLKFDRNALLTGDSHISALEGKGVKLWDGLLNVISVIGS